MNEALVPGIVRWPRPAATYTGEIDECVCDVGFRQQTGRLPCDR
jgi:hypothetical protein